ncbi:hypothetical protein BJ875DRAFT_536871 [Amylocarpus encephaloides]|uniref:Uncharacterized protein n=1 Tax=Amylocarpus encephaloides TaxID=45428 RepID=A0A9P7YBW8_9HELO|nr:hypothetical protein BJ875DRAFT_536871 [Amylocarpus encephaloides]
MLSKILLVALAASPLAAAHGKIAVMTGDAGGNTTALGIQGAVVPGAGKNKVTEVDTTVFKSKAAATDGLGKASEGPNTMVGIDSVMEQSGCTLPQVSPGGSLSGTIHIVTTDGAGPYTAIVDPTATGQFSTGTKAEVTTQVPGKNGNNAAPKQRSLFRRTLVKIGIEKRASNVNEDYPIIMTIPADMKCTRTVGDKTGVCLVKIANPSGAGPFGGVVAMQMASASTAVLANDVSTASMGTTAKASKAYKATRGELVSAKFRASINFISPSS